MRRLYADTCFFVDVLVGLALSLGLIFGLTLLLVSSESVQAETIAQPMDACPTPHNDCAAACGTTCTYWTCGDYTSIPVPINRLPMTFIRANAQCTQRLEEVMLRQLPLTQSQQDRMVDEVNHLPMSFRADSHACVSKVKAGPACVWQTGSWGSCSATCGGGTQTRTVTCSGAYCNPADKPAESQPCNTQACSWLPGGWSGCSATCGGGTQTRTVTCSGSYCDPATMPPTSATCNTNYCSWATGDWGACSASCGGGTQTRSVWCAGGSCDPATMPTSSQACNTNACAPSGCTATIYTWGDQTCTVPDPESGIQVCTRSESSQVVTIPEGQSRVFWYGSVGTCQFELVGSFATHPSFSQTKTCVNGVLQPQEYMIWYNGITEAQQEAWRKGRWHVWTNTVYRSGGVCGQAGSPLLIHMGASADKVEPLVFTSQLNGINFDLFGLNATPQPNTPVRISWYRSPNYYFITLPDEKGEVNGIDELFGNNTAGPDKKFAPDGYWALAKFDGRTADGLTKIGEPDGYITKDDPVLAKLRFWHDDNFDGKAQPKELRTADELGIELIDLKADSSFKETDQYGNDTLLKSVVRTKDGRYHVMFDVWFYSFPLDKLDLLKKAFEEQRERMSRQQGH